MKRLLLLKQIDLAGQLLMLLPLGLLLTDRPVTAVTAYFTVGSWQTISCILTATLRTKPVTNDRSTYTRTLAWILGVFAVLAGVVLLIESMHGAGSTGLHDLGGIAAGGALIEAGIMLFVAPFMALWYCRITLEEIRLLREQPEESGDYNTSLIFKDSAS